ncbi:hypothetical protein RKD22_004099 [Streptomyces pristinaespiralis]
MSGVGDNSQVHILLAGCLVGDPEQGMVGGERPALSWAEGATGGEPHLGPDPVWSRLVRAGGLPAAEPVVETGTALQAEGQEDQGRDRGAQKEVGVLGRFL